MTTGQFDDTRLLDDVIGVFRATRARAPHDFLTLLALGLGAVIFALLALTALVGDGLFRDLLLNISSEIAGAWLTVVLIDGLWRRVQVGAFAQYEVMINEVERRKQAPLSDQEREAWQLFVAGYRGLDPDLRSGNPFQQVRAIYRFFRRMRSLEARGNQVISTFNKAIQQAVEQEEADSPLVNGAAAQDARYAEELAALREEIVRLHKLVEERIGQRL